MKNKEIRLVNLGSISDQYRTIEEFANAAGLDAGLVRQIMSGYRNIGPKTAEKIERSFGKPEGWMDQVNIDPGELNEYALTIILKQLEGQSLNAEQKAAIIAAYYKDALSSKKVNLEPSIRLISQAGRRVP